MQHLLAILAPIVTPGLLICQALGVSRRDTTLIVSMPPIISGIATYMQCKHFGPLGAGGSVMVRQDTPVEAVMAAIFGVVIAGSFIEMGLSRILPFVKRLIPPLVTGIVVLLSGLTLSCLVLGTSILLNRVPVVWIRGTALVMNWFLPEKN